MFRTLPGFGSARLQQQRAPNARSGREREPHISAAAVHQLSGTHISLLQIFVGGSLLSAQLGAWRAAPRSRARPPPCLPGQRYDSRASSEALRVGAALPALLLTTYVGSATLPAFLMENRSRTPCALGALPPAARCSGPRVPRPLLELAA